MKAWTNTKALDGLIDNITLTPSKQEAEVLIMGSKTVTLADFPKAKGIFRVGVGSDNIPKDAAEKNVQVRMPSPETTAHIFDETARFAVSLVYKCAFSETGNFSTWTKQERPSFKNQTCLVLGLGQIGTRVKDILKSSMQVSTFDIRENKPEELSALVKGADYITLHISNLPENRQLIGEKLLGNMKSTACLINTARGSLVNEEALFESLIKDKLRLAALDVFSEEPYSGPLTKLSPRKVILSPHVASNCFDFRQGCAKELNLFMNELS